MQRAAAPRCCARSKHRYGAGSRLDRGSGQVAPHHGLCMPFSCHDLSVQLTLSYPQTPISPLQATDYRASATGRGACAADVQRFCRDVEPGRGRTHACLREHMQELRCGRLDKGGLAGFPQALLLWAGGTGWQSLPLAHQPMACSRVNIMVPSCLVAASGAARRSCA